MVATIATFDALISENLTFFKTVSLPILEEKVSEEKWSKKEILGHLVDSSIHNMVRFTEINYAAKPYIYRTYNQTDLVKINLYQEMAIDELLQLWESINNQIIRLFKSVTEENLAYEIQLADNSIVNLKYLMTDYVSHLKHHIHQIKNS